MNRKNLTLLLLLNTILTNILQIHINYVSLNALLTLCIVLYMYTVVYVKFFVTVLGHQNCDRASKPLVKSQLLLSKVHWTPVNLSGSHKLMGELDTCVQDLAQMQPGTALSLINGKKKQKKI